MIASITFFMMLMVAVQSCSEEDIKPTGTFEQIFPEDRAKDILVQPKFRWNDATGVKSYTLQISKTSDFNTILIEKEGIKTSNYTLENPLDEGYLYYWRIKAVNTGGELLSTNAGISFRTVASPLEPSPTISVYHVAPMGEDNPDRGTIDNPFKTLAYAATRVPESEGDTILLSSGIFMEVEPAVIPIGVSVIGAGQAQTILSSAGVAIPKDVDKNASDFKLWFDGALIQLVSKHRTIFRNVNSSAVQPSDGNQTISGFTIDGNNKNLKAGVWVENRNNVTMHHVTFKDLAQRGAVFAPGNKNWYSYPDYYMTDIKIHDCVFVNSGKDLTEETLGNLNIAQLDGAEIFNISITDNEGYGIKFIYDGYFKNTKIYDCTISLSETDVKWGEDIAIELWNVGPGNEIGNINSNTWLSIVNHPEIFGNPKGTENMKIHDVKIIDNDGTSGKEAIELGAPGVEVSQAYIENKGFGIAVWDMGRSDIVIRNSIFYNTTPKANWAEGAAIYIDNSRTWAFSGIDIYNNVFENHRKAIKIKGEAISNIEIRNNVFLHTELADVDASGTNIFFTNNLKYNPLNSNWLINGVTYEVANILGIPGFSNTGDRFSTYYTPASDSSIVVDKGIDVGIPFKGAFPDIGYFEY